MVSGANQIKALNPLTGVAPAARAAANNKVRDEFLTIFYKELLKQVFKAPNFNPTGNSEENGQVNEFNFGTAFGQDLMLDQLAEQLVKNAKLNAQLIAPTEIPEGNK